MSVRLNVPWLDGGRYALTVVYSLACAGSPLVNGLRLFLLPAAAVWVGMRPGPLSQLQEKSESHPCEHAQSLRQVHLRHQVNLYSSAKFSSFPICVPKLAY
jgi:hypothetical protein